MSEILSIISKDIRERSQITSELGLLGERVALDFLIRTGYRIVVTNFKAPVGRNGKGVQVTGEIDIVALEGETLCFIEVKTRRSDAFAPIIANIDKRKQRQITRTAKVYRRLFDITEVEYRYDVISVLMPEHGDPKIELTKGFWSDSVFKKRVWINAGWDEPY